MLAIVAFAMNRGEGLEDRTWVVQEMSIDGTMTAPIVQATPYAIFDNGGIGGSAGCNTYNGGYEAGSGSITIGPLMTTLMFCEAPQGRNLPTSPFCNRQTRSKWTATNSL